VGASGQVVQGVIDVDITKSVPDWEPYTQPIAPEGTPNVLYIVLDDVGFSAMEPFGGLIETPNINRIAECGLTYTNFHTTALCSPTRACLMTGRNHTTNGGATITEAASGYTSSNGDIPMLRYSGGKDRPGLRLLVLHDDPEREFAYTSGADRSLETAAAEGWAVVSIKDDWSVVFAE
jgi:hypothetical protein